MRNYKSRPATSVVLPDILSLRNGLPADGKPLIGFILNMTDESYFFYHICSSAS